jgi:hypothetical protein
MKTTLLTALTMTVLIGASSAQAPQSSPAAPVPAQQLTQTQAAHLIGAASTPGDHRELAQYFRREAEQKRQKVRYYSEVAATYRVHPPRVDAYRNMSTAEYYQHLAMRPGMQPFPTIKQRPSTTNLRRVLSRRSDWRIRRSPTHRDG